MPTDVQNLRDVDDTADAGPLIDTGQTVLSPAGRKAMQGEIDPKSADLPTDPAADGPLTDAANTTLSPPADELRMVHPRSSPETLRIVEGETFPIATPENLSGYIGGTPEGYSGGGERGG